jgi:hypothetical protein
MAWLPPTGVNSRKVYWKRRIISAMSYLDMLRTMMTPHNQRTVTGMVKATVMAMAMETVKGMATGTAEAMDITNLKR